LHCATSAPNRQVWDKADNQGPVTEADLAVNAYLHEHLTAARPGYGWLSEESDPLADLFPPVAPPRLHRRSDRRHPRLSSMGRRAGPMRWPWCRRGSRWPRWCICRRWA
jgi:3'-phosphoadenosine 5'-phosphosulfate (PAPS) 3'-phosphatase